MSVSLKLLVWIARIVLGGVFIFSGFVKAIDPLGSAYKFQDYFMAFNLDWLMFSALPSALLLSTLEFVIGIGILLGLKMRLSAWGGLLFMAVFTPLTLYIAITDPVPDCGCFGDAIIISNWATFNKNVFLLAAAIIVFVFRNKISPLLSKKADGWLLLLFTIGILWLSVHCLRNLPIIDFRPWKTGNDITELVMPTEEIADTYLIFENTETGEIREYPADDYPWDDPEWAAVWEYKDRRDEVIQPYQEAKIEDFYIEDEFGDDLTGFYMTKPGYLFMVVAPDLHRSNTRAFEERVTPLAKEAEAMGYPLIVLTGSTQRTVDEFRHSYQTPYPFYLSDEIELKTIIRSNPGLVLMKEGVVKGKWAHRNIPALEEIMKETVN